MALAKHHPVSFTVITVGGLAAAATVFWAIGHFHPVDRIKSTVGL